MDGTTSLMIGAGASCTDGACGEVSRVVVDPVARAVTHVVVEPAGRQGLGRLVPLDMVDATGGDVQIRCTLAEFENLGAAEETQFVPGTRGYAAYGPEQVLAWPYSSLAGIAPMDGEIVSGVSETITYDTVPLGEIAVRRGDRVHATDGAIGHVEGLVIDPRNHHVTHVLLQEGHLWGRKEVAIPITAVTGADDGIGLNLAKNQVRDLPSVDIDHPAG
jgi:sporulation protein YlmC with PRC-barrel domain